MAGAGAPSTSALMVVRVPPTRDSGPGELWAERGTRPKGRWMVHPTARLRIVDGEHRRAVTRSADSALPGTPDHPRPSGRGVDSHAAAVRHGSPSVRAGLAPANSNWRLPCCAQRAPHSPQWATPAGGGSPRSEPSQGSTTIVICKDPHTGQFGKGIAPSRITIRGVRDS